MNSSKPLVSVVIPHLNQFEDLERCLSSLHAQTLHRSQFEVIVVDNGSSSSPEPIVVNYPNARLLHEPTPGPGPARNTGILDARGEVLALIDADCRAHPTWLANAVLFIRSAPERTVLGGDVRIWRDGRSLTAIAAYESVFAYRFKLYVENHGFSGTGNLVVKREDFLSIGLFAGINIAEDKDWGHRARRSGYRFRYEPELIVFHPARNSLHELRVKWDRHLQHYLNEARGKPSWRFRWIIRAVAVLLSPAVDFVKILSSDRIEGGAARFKAILVLIAIRFYRFHKMISLLWERQMVVWNRTTGISDPGL